jgi:hypothetical protein
LHDDLRNTYYFRQFLILGSFVPTITEIAKLTKTYPKSVGPMSPTVLVAVELEQY